MFTKMIFSRSVLVKINNRRLVLLLVFCILHMTEDDLLNVKVKKKKQYFKKTVIKNSALWCIPSWKKLNVPTHTKSLIILNNTQPRRHLLF